ncbi:DUF3060 domain-containing protein [Curtobacterium sp. P97]|uniref:DUF3060 domain-containing protein n=1 Tax=unclassified Curtobacterium TaxID=257496 RepID=UPI00204078A9|nr:DUF3060 domain-containing protein [Curtobacterium sp. P97]MCM3522042.1 DUF3060 domain-containing protein [Curtobacterium sp. P97]
MHLIRSLTLVALTAALSFGAASCSSEVTDPPGPTPSSTTAEAVYNTCVDGAVQLWDQHGGDAPITAEDCAAANLISADRQYVLDGIATITVEASGTTIEVTGAERIVITGDDNTVHWRGTPPQIDDQGQRNTASAA